MGLVNYKSNKTGEVVQVDFPLHSKLLELIHADGSTTQAFSNDFATEWVQQAPELTPIDGSKLEQLADPSHAVVLAPPSSAPAAAKPVPALPTSELLTAFGRIKADIAGVVSEGHAKILEELRAGHSWTARIESMLVGIVDHLEKLHEGHALIAKLLADATSDAPAKTDEQTQQG